MPQFDDLMQRCFKGLYNRKCSACWADKRVIQALERLKETRLFHHDVVTNGGIRLGATRVRRILVGERITCVPRPPHVCHPWRGEGARKNSRRCSSSTN